MNRFIVLVFVVIVALPLGANIAGVDGADPEAENRTLAPFPALQPSLESIRNYPAGFTAWFEDHFGFRARLVRWYGETRLFALRVSPTPSVVNGRDDWFFYGEDGSLDDYAHVDPLTPAAQDNWREAVGRARDWLRQRHVPYVFFVAPDKYAIYPEMMPRTIEVLGPVSRTDQLYHALAHGGVAVDFRGALMAAKARERIYQKTDTHWNDRGAHVAYQAIVEAVRRQLPTMPPAWTRDDFEPATRVVNGMDLAGMMGLTRVIRGRIWCWCRSGRAWRGSSSPPAPKRWRRKDGSSPKFRVRRCRAR